MYETIERFDYDEHNQELIKQEYELQKTIEHYSKKRITLDEFYELASKIENKISKLHYEYNVYHNI